MPVSSLDQVSIFYDDAADGYDVMMNEEIKLPWYNEVLSSLADHISSIDGAVLDASCGSGHMLEKLHNEFTQQRQLFGIDLSPKMVAIARERLGDAALVSQGDMRDLADFSDASCAAAISFFSLHHIDADDLVGCLAEWHRVLVPSGQLVIATWEGDGAIDYGDQTDILTRRYRESELIEALKTVGFLIDRHCVVPVDGFEMDAVHIPATKIAP